MATNNRPFIAKDGIFPFEYYLLRAHFLSRLLDKNPQCDGCEHMLPLVFTLEYYRDYMLTKYCPSCPKFEGAYVEKSLPHATDFYFEDLEDNDHGDIEK